MNNLPVRNIICIDLKSFFASCECIDRGLDPFKVPLVVAGSNKGAITLAVTPYLKSKGIKGRTRLYDIPKNIKYIKVPPRMALYTKKSKEVISIYLDYVASEDLHIYSIDECFLDLTAYLKMYKKTDYEIAEEILRVIEHKTGLTATCGIGPNLLIAKVAMDVEAKKHKNGIAKWEYKDIPDKFYPITPLSKFCGIGPRMEKRLNNLGITTIGQLAHYDKQKLKHLFGIMGEELYEHANGIDLSCISDMKTLPKDKSYGHSQILYKDYNGDNIKLIIMEMVDVLTTRLRAGNKECLVIGFGIGYSKAINGGFYHSIKLDNTTDNSEVILKQCLLIFDKFYNESPIRKVSISLGGLTEKAHLQLNMFDSIERIKIKDNYDKTIDEIRNKYGKNSILKATSLLNDSTAIERNKKIGGHSA